MSTTPSSNPSPSLKPIPRADSHTCPIVTLTRLTLTCLKLWASKEVDECAIQAYSMGFDQFIYGERERCGSAALLGHLGTVN